MLSGLGGAFGAVHVSIEKSTLDELLSAAAVYEVGIELSEANTLTVIVDQARVLGLQPDTPDRAGRILTSVRLRVPQLGLTLRTEPRLSVGVIEQDGRSLLELRFEAVPLNLGVGSLDLARFLAPLRYPADEVFLMGGAQGDVEVRSRVRQVVLESDRLRLELSLDVLPPAAPASNPAPGNR